MSIPHRGETSCTTYFITAGTYCKQNILQSERMAELSVGPCTVIVRPGNSKCTPSSLCPTTFTCS